MGLGDIDPWVGSHMWPQQTWGQRSSRGQWPLFQVFEKGSLYPHTLMYFRGTWTQWSLGRITHVTSPDLGSKAIVGQWPLVQVFEKRVSVSTYFVVFSIIILQWLQKYVIPKAGETRVSRTGLFTYIFQRGHEKCLDQAHFTCIHSYIFCHLILSLCVNFSDEGMFFNRM